MLERFSERAKKAMQLARRSAVRFHHPRILPEHVLLGILDEGTGVGASAVRHLGIDIARLRAEIEGQLAPGIPGMASHSLPFSEGGRKVLGCALAAASERHHPHIGTEHLLLGLLRANDDVAAKTLVKLGVTFETARAAAAELQTSPEGVHLRADQVPAKRAKSARGELEAIAVDLVARTRKQMLRPISSHFDELETLKGILAAPERRSALLLGGRGHGKTSTLHALARDISIGRVPTALLAKRLLALEPLRLVAGCKYKDQLEERVDAIVREAERAKDVILVLDDLEDFLPSLGEKSDTADLHDVLGRLLPAIERGAVQAVASGSCTAGGGDALRRRFSPPLVCVALPPASDERALQFLFELREQYETHHRVTLTESAIRMAVQLALGGRNPLACAARLIDDACAAAHAAAFTPPLRVAQLSREIARLEEERERCFQSQDFEGAARAFEENRQNVELRHRVKREWKNALRDSLRVIDEQKVAETYARNSAPGGRTLHA